MKKLFAIALLAFSGCGKESSAPLPETARTVTVTNFVDAVRTVTVTNTVTLTNVVAKRSGRVLSLRRTAPYLVAGGLLDRAQLRALASECGARVLECETGAVALVEASDKAAESLRAGGVLRVHALTARDKIAGDAGGAVKIIPVSTIDSAAVVKAVRESGGEILQVVTAGSPAVRAKVSFAAMKKIAERGDVRRIERDGK
jgi:hypothetical protein